MKASELPLWVVYRHWFIKVEEQLPPKLTLAEHQPETIYGQEPTLSAYANSNTLASAAIAKPRPGIWGNVR